MGIIDVANTLTQAPALLKVKKALAPQPSSTPGCMARNVESVAAKFPDRTAILFEGQSITWQAFNEQANRYAHAFVAQGIQPGDTISLMMENRIEFLQLIVALNKIGSIGALINTNLTGKPLIHCITTTESKFCIFGEELLAAITEVKSELPLVEGTDYLYVPDLDQTTTPNWPNWAANLNELATAESIENPPQTQKNLIGDNAFYIFTSGTTGLPKAAVISNKRVNSSGAMAYQAGFKCTEKDRIYICLPLYHGTGLIVGAGAALASGASMFIRRKFSASKFLAEVRDNNTTCLIYIGELCRYLINSPAQADDHKNPLTKIMGNGMRPDVWMEFKERFGIKRVAEFYAASEGNVAFANLMNKDCTVGFTTSEHAVVRYDVDADEIIRDEAGHCLRVEPGEPGLLLGKIVEGAEFEGYTNPEATEAKIIRDAFDEGDAWFNSGDLLKQIDVGFTLGFPHYQFVDRVGDTFRWKSENVSTNEVGEILNGFEHIKFSNVYGVEVPKADGRAGMAVVTLTDGNLELDTGTFSKFVRESLPGYAQPVFVRIQPDIDVTGTFKLVKGDLRKQGYDINQFSDLVYVMKPGTTEYVLMDENYLKMIARGEAGF